MSIENQPSMPGAVLEAQFNAMGINRLTEAELMERYGGDEVVMTAEQTEDACNNVAFQIMVQELGVLGEAYDADEVYEPPVVISLLNGAAPATTRIMETLCAYGFELEPAYMNPSGYGDSMTVGEVIIKKELTPDEFKRISGRRVIIIDDVHDTGNTVKTTEEYLAKRIEEGINVPYEDGVLYEDLAPIASLQFAFLWDKEPDPSASGKEPDFVGGVIPKDWVTGGLGCNTELPNGDSVGRFSLALFRSATQPK